MAIDALIKAAAAAGYLVRAGEKPFYPWEYGYSRVVYQPVKRKIMRGISKYMYKKTKDKVYAKARASIDLLSRQVEQLAKRLPPEVTDHIARRLSFLGKTIKLTGSKISPKIVVDELKTARDYAKKKAKEYGILAKRYPKDVLEKIQSAKDIAKRFKGANLFRQKDWATDFFKQYKKEGKYVYTDREPFSGTEYEGVAELFNQNSTNPIVDENVVVEEDLLVPVPEDEGIVEQHTQKRLREPGPKEIDNMIGDVADLVDSVFERKKRIKLSKGAKIAKDLLKGGLPSQYSNISISDVPIVVDSINKANRQKLHYNTFRAGRSNDYIPTQTMVNFLKNKF